MRELLLTTLGGNQYGIWKDDVLSVRDIKALHRIPLSSPCIAGIMVDGDHTVTLADLAVCLGDANPHSFQQGCILLKQVGDKVLGIALSGEVRTQSIAPELIFPLPDFLKTPVFETCAVHDGVSFPIVNTAVVLARLLDPDQAVAAVACGAGKRYAEEAEACREYSLVSLCGDQFALPATGLQKIAAGTGPITPLPGTPAYVRGVTFCQGHLLPVIDLALRIKCRAPQIERQLLVAEVSGESFGLLVDEALTETVSVEDVAIKPAPLIVQSGWMRNMLQRNGELVPLIDLALALSSVAALDKPLSQRYTPDSRFPAVFFSQDVNVLEFSLLGERHAVPKVEIEDVINFQPYRKLPDVPLLVIGVTEHEDEVLPVLDMAMMFSRRSVATPEWRMMLIKNGDFRALALTDQVFGEHVLGRDMQRAMPIHLPHNLVYGCYPDEKQVRLVMNVEAIAVHFEKTLIDIFMPSLTPEMKMSATGVPYHFHDDHIAPQENVDEKQALTPVATETPAEAATESTLCQGEDGIQPGRAAVPAGGEPTTAPVKKKKKAAQAREDAHAWDGLDVAAPAETVTDAGQEEKSAQAEIATPAAVAVPVEDDASSAELSHGEALQADKSDFPVSNAEQPLVMEEVQQEISVPPQADVETSGHGGEQARLVKEASASAQQPEISVAAPIAERQVTPEVRKHAVSVSHTDARSGSLYQEEEVATGRVRKSSYIVIAVLLLLAVVYFGVTLNHAPADKSPSPNEPAKLAQDEPVQTRQQAVKQQAAPLEIEIPRNMPAVSIDVYVVVKDDTLWSISERFTGDPYNYPRIAGENKLANPDLIFPGQRIRLIK